MEEEKEEEEKAMVRSAPDGSDKYSTHIKGRKLLLEAFHGRIFHQENSWAFIKKCMKVELGPHVDGI